MGPERKSFILVVTLVIAASLLLAQSAPSAWATRVNVMPDRQVRPGVSLPVFGNAGNGGGIGDGSATGENYSWSFSANPNVLVTDDGDLTGIVGNDRYIVEDVTFTLLNGSTREIITATLDVGGTTDTVEIDIVDPTDPISADPLDNLSVEVNIAIEDGLRAMYLAQQPNGSWPGAFSNSVYNCAATGFSIWAFANSGHLPSNDIDADIYAEFVQQGIDWILTRTTLQGPIVQPNIGDPDQDGNGRILSLCGNSNQSPVGYANGMATAGIIAAYSAAQNTVVADNSFPGQVNGTDTYANVVQDAADWVAFAQDDATLGRGGWRYFANFTSSDTSADSWNYVALEGAEAVFGSIVLEAVKAEAELRINESQSQGGPGDFGQFGYTTVTPLGFDGNATTAGGLSGLAMVTAGGRTPVHLDPPGALTGAFGDSQGRKDAALAHVGLRWDASPSLWGGNRGNFYAMWTTARALRLNGATTLVDRNGVTFDWETGEDQANLGVLPPDNDVHEGYFPFLVRTQAANGAWPTSSFNSNYNANLNTAWGVLILQPTVFGPPEPDVVEVAVDIKPTSCPNPVNCKAGGVQPVAILGTADFDVLSIDPSTIVLEGPAGEISPTRWSIEDVATPYEPLIGKQGCEDCTTAGPDGFSDLTLKFDNREVVQDVIGPGVADRTCLVLRIKGNLVDSTAIAGEDVIRVQCRGGTD